MRKTLAAIIIASAVAAPAAAFAAGDWMVRIRALKMDPKNESEPVPGLAPADAIHVEDRVFPEVDFSYFFTPNWRPN